MTKTDGERARLSFVQHRMTRVTGNSWRCAKPGTWIYGFHVTWAPGAIIVTGDIGELVINHYSAAHSLWGAVHWVNGSGYDYVLGKSTAKKEFDAAATIRDAVEHAYREWRDGNKRPMRRLVDRANIGYGKGHADDWAVRKECIRDLLDRDLSESDAYEITGDSECLRYAYTYAHLALYEAVQWWAREMFRTEPAWHRAWRQIRSQTWQIKRWRRDLVWAPVLYYQPSKDGRPVMFNGARYWTWRPGRSDGGCYVALSPFRPFGVDLTRYGFWLRQGSSQPGFSSWRNEPRDQFVDVRPGDPVTP